MGAVDDGAREAIKDLEESLRQLTEVVNEQRAILLSTIQRLDRFGEPKPMLDPEDLIGPQTF
jgi:hypothetical protein